MKTPITLAIEAQKKGMAVSFWFHQHTPEIVEVNVHTTPKKPDGGIVTKKFKNPTPEKINEFLSACLNGEIKYETNDSTDDN